MLAEEDKKTKGQSCKGVASFLEDREREKVGKTSTSMVNIRGIQAVISGGYLQ
jgi:hypothetical protein